MNPILRRVGPRQARFADQLLCLVLCLVPCLLLLAMCLPAAAQTPIQPGTANPPASAPMIAPDNAEPGPTNAGNETGGTSNLAIGPGDLIEVSVFDVPDLSGRFRVNDFGYIDLPVAGRMHVAGLDADTAARQIEQRLRQADIVKNPGVHVFIMEYASQGVSVLGDVKAPGVYPILGSRRLLDVLASAGGLSLTAGRDIRIQHRGDFDHPELIRIDNITVQPTSNPVVQAGDTITVPRSGVVYVLGDVGKPGGYLVENNNRLDLLKLLALAGGPNRTAGLKKTKLIRTTASGRVEIDIELKSVMEGRSQSILLQDSDILYVPTSEKKYLAYRSIEAAIQVGTGVALYRNF